MKKYTHILIIALVGLLSTSCITNKQKTYLQEESRKTYRQVPFKPYRLNVNDELIYYLLTSDTEAQALYNQMQGGTMSSQNQQVYRIYEDGCVVLPTIGQVKVAGYTLREAEILLSEKFKSVVVDSEVKLAIANNYFYVQGDGGKGQFYMYKDNLTIFQALALAGDISSMGDKKHVKVIRKGSDGRDYEKTFDIRKESIIESEYYYVRPNDVIYIPTNPNSFFRVESVSSFISLIIAPISLLSLILANL